MADRFPTARFLAIVLSLSLLSGRATSQQKPVSDDDTVKISAELVQIDVVVTDKAGKVVSGLKREDFQLLDNNKPQLITHFAYEENRTHSLTEEAGGASLHKAITAPEVKRVMAFVVDTLHIKVENLFQTRQMLEDFVDHKMQPGDVVLILPTAGGAGLYQQFTSDQRLLRRAIAHLRPFIFTNDTTPHRSMPAPSNQTSSVMNGTAGGRGRRGVAPVQPPQRASTPPLPGTNPDPLEAADVITSLSTLNNLIHAMGKMPGRKMGVFISEGLRIFQTDTDSDLANTTALAARSSVVLYTIDPRGLESLSLAAADDPGDQEIGDFLDSKRNDFYESRDSLNAMAVDTGGKFFRDSNDIRAGLSRLLEENSAYYLLGFQPESSKWDGKFHRVKVEVKDHPELLVSTRKGYLARDEKAKTPASVDPKVAADVEAINSPLVRRDIDLQLTPFFTDDAKREPRVINLVHVDASNLHFQLVDGKYKDKLETVSVVVDITGKIVDADKNTLDLNLEPPRFQEMLKAGLLWTRIMTLKAGTYQIRSLVREPDTGLIGTANNFVDVPDLRNGHLAISSVFAEAEAEAKDPGKSDGKGSLSQRRFKRGDKLAYSTTIYNAKGGNKSQPDLEQRARILSGTKVIYAGPFKPVVISDNSNLPSRIVTGGLFQLARIEAGDYTLEITVIDKLRKKDKDALVRQEVDFSVE